MYKYKERLRLYKRWPCSTYILNRINWRECSVTWSAIFVSHMNHVSVSPTDGTGPTQGQRKTLTRVGIETTTFGLDLLRSTDWATRSDGSRPWELKMLKSYCESRVYLGQYNYSPVSLVSPEKTFSGSWVISLLSRCLETRPSVRVHWFACGTCSVPGKLWLAHGPITGLQKQSKR